MAFIFISPILAAYFWHEAVISRRQSKYLPYEPTRYTPKMAIFGGIVAFLISFVAMIVSASYISDEEAQDGKSRHVRVSVGREIKVTEENGDDTSSQNIKISTSETFSHKEEAKNSKTLKENSVIIY